MVGGQLHNEGGGVACKRLGLFQDDAGKDDGRHADEVGGHRHQAAAAEQGAGEQADDGHLGPAGHEAGGHDRHPAVALVLNGTGGHDAGHAAAGADEHGDKALAAQAELAEDTVHDERHAGHVAHILQDGQHQEQHQHLGHEAQHRAHAGNDAVHNQPLQPGGGADALQPAAHRRRHNLAEQHVVGPTGHPVAHRADGHIVHRKHDHRENRQGQNPVGHNPVNLVRGGQAVGRRLLLHGLVHNPVDVRVPLVGDDALRVVVQLLLAVGDVGLQVSLQLTRQIQLGHHLVVPLKHLDGVPPQVTVVHQPRNGLLDVGDGVLHAAREHVGQLTRPVGLGQRHGLLRRGHAALALQRAHAHHLAPQGLPQPAEVDLVPVLPHQVDHVDRNHHRNPQLDELRRQVQVALDVRAVHDVQNRVRLLTHQIAPRHHFLPRVRRQRVDAGQVLNDHLLVALQLAFLFLHCYAGPVAHVLV